MPLEGMRLGQYTLIRLLGSGGMGEVYLAADPRIDQQVAIKVCRVEVSTYPTDWSAEEAARLFQREAKAIASLDHPHILPLFGYGEEQLDDMLLTYIIMSYRREGSLTTWLQQHAQGRPLADHTVASLIHQAADALQYAHDH